MNDDLISIILPVYNVEKYLPRCLGCLCKQTYKNIEIICIDDKSTDRSLTICEEAAKKDVRIHIQKNENNIGPSATRNIGINISKGKYVFFIDSDDFIDENTIQLLYEQTQNGMVDIVSCNFCFYYGKDNKQDVYLYDKEIAFYDLSQENAFSQLLTQETNYRCVWAKLIKKEVMNGLSFPEGYRYGEDMIFTSKLILNATTIKHLNKVLYFYNQEGISLVRSGVNNEKLKEVDIVKGWISITKEKFPKLVEKANAYYYKTIINLCIVARRNNLIVDSNSLKKEIKSYFPKILKNTYITVKMKLKAIYIMLFYRG